LRFKLSGERGDENVKRRKDGLVQIAAQQNDARKHLLVGDLTKYEPNRYTRGQQTGDSGMNNSLLSRRYGFSLAIGCLGSTLCPTWRILTAE
jgi:hypothetical protein